MSPLEMKKYECKYKFQILVSAANLSCVSLIWDVCIPSHPCPHSKQLPSHCLGFFPFILALGPTQPLSTNPSHQNRGVRRSRFVQDTHTDTLPTDLRLKITFHDSLPIHLYRVIVGLPLEQP